MAECSGKVDSNKVVMAKELDYDKYKKRGVYHCVRYRSVMEALEQSDAKKVLDVGCGDGALLCLSL